ncbi:MAG: preprotein translocase subunit YajC [Butyricicoccaceae bacterium]
MIRFALDSAMPSLADYASFLPLILLIVLFYFMLIRPQRKKDKEDKAMRDALKVGDTICTIGGIIGKVTSITEDTVTIETSSARSKIKFYKWAIRNVETDKPAEAKEEK